MKAVKIAKRQKSLDIKVGILRAIIRRILLLSVKTGQKINYPLIRIFSFF